MRRSVIQVMEFNSETVNKINAILSEHKNCSIATTDKVNIDNSLVAFYAEDLKLYFGSFTNTLKGKFISINPYVAINIYALQMHGVATLLDRNSGEFKQVYEKYIMRFPQYKSFFEYENNEMYRIDPLVYWIYDNRKGMMHRDKVIFDMDYYIRLSPYETPQKFKRRNFYTINL
jgi:hypothetical protein